MTVAYRTFTVLVHEAEEGGYWAEVLELPGCASQGETLDEVRQNIKEAMTAVLYADTEMYDTWTDGDAQLGQSMTSQRTLTSTATR